MKKGWDHLRKYPKWLGAFFKKDVRKATKAAFAGICAAIICATLVGILMRPLGFHADAQASFFKVLDTFLVFKKPVDKFAIENLHLFSQYPQEYKLGHPDGWIGDKDILEIFQENRPLWLGVANAGPRTLHNVQFILYPPGDLVVPNGAIVERAWLKAEFGQERKLQYQYATPVTIPARIGWVIPVPIEFKFPKVGDYLFSYAVSSDEAPLFRGAFTVRRNQ